MDPWPRIYLRSAANARRARFTKRYICHRLPWEPSAAIIRHAASGCDLQSWDEQQTLIKLAVQTPPRPNLGAKIPKRLIAELAFRRATYCRQLHSKRMGKIFLIVIILGIAVLLVAAVLFVSL